MREYMRAFYFRRCISYRILIEFRTYASLASHSKYVNVADVFNNTPKSHKHKDEKYISYWQENYSYEKIEINI